MSKKVSFEDMVKQLNDWHREVNNFRNDGYVQEGYREKITDLHDRILTIMTDIAPYTNTEAPEEKAPPAVTVTVPGEARVVYRANPRDDE